MCDGDEMARRLAGHAAAGKAARGELADLKAGLPQRLREYAQSPCLAAPLRVDLALAAEELERLTPKARA
jgi:hypothetical protein